MITFLSLKIFHKEGVAAFISILFTLFLSQIPYYTSFMLPFFWTGIYIRKYLLNIEKNDKKILPASFLLFIGMLFFWDGYYTIYCTPLNIIHLRALSIDTNFIHTLCIALFRFSIGFAGIFFFILSSRKLCEKYPNNRYINYVSSHFGKHTMGIYIIQNLIIERYRYQLIDFGGYNWFYNWIITPGFSIIVILLCSVIIKIIEKNKYTDFLLLGKKLS